MKMLGDKYRMTKWEHVTFTVGEKLEYDLENSHKNCQLITFHHINIGFAN